MVNHLICIECLSPAAEAVMARGGASLCRQCAEAFYAPCSVCQGLIPRDETVLREDLICCLECFAKPQAEAEAESLGAEELAALIAEFVRLHAEEKKLKDQVEEIKEKLKRHAATQPRASNAVILRAGEHAVKCGYAVRISYNEGKLAVVEELVGAEQFAALFEREVKFNPVKESLEKFLADEGEDWTAARAAILAAMERKETVTLAPVASKNSLGKASKKSASPTEPEQK